MHRERFYTLTASCPDRVGIVAAVSGFFAKHGGWILETTLHSEPPNEEGVAAYFMRLEIKADSLPFDLDGLRAAFQPVADEFAMTWKISDSAQRKRVVILVSKQEHCLYDLLARWQSKELDVEIPCVISNHETLRGFVEWHGIPFHYVPVTPDNKAQAYAKGCSAPAIKFCSARTASITSLTPAMSLPIWLRFDKRSSIRLSRQLMFRFISMSHLLEQAINRPRWPASPAARDAIAKMH